MEKSDGWMGSSWLRQSCFICIYPAREEEKDRKKAKEEEREGKDIRMDESKSILNMVRGFCTFFCVYLVWLWLI